MLATQSRSSVEHSMVERILDARRKSDDLFKIVHPDSLYGRPIPERHRIIFYVGHLEAFDWNLLHESVFGITSFHPEFDRLFAFGIDPVGGGLPSDQPSDWPSRQSVGQYVAEIRATLDEKLADAMSTSNIQTRDGFPLVTLLNVAIEHRLMHVETLAYMLHQLPPEQKIPQPNLPEIVTEPPIHRMIEIPEGVTTLGLPGSDGTFGWDNEFDAYRVPVPGFKIAQYKVTNAQYLDFIDAGGYETRALWSSEDWNWKDAKQISHPAFWKKSGSRWLLRTMFQEIPLPPSWPVYVSHAEATAYANWAGKLLPSEEQWQRAAYGTPDEGERPYPWGREAPAPQFGNFDFERWDPAPANAFPAGQSAFGVHDQLGNGWEWTSTAFGPFPGFAPFPFYRGYSADFFDGKHFVLKGGSSRTAASLLRSSFRNWFQAHYQYVYASFRCVNP